MRALHASLLSAVVLLSVAAPGVTATAATADGASLDRLGVWQAPTDAVDLNEAADVRAAIDEGVLTRATAVNSSDTLVIGVQIRGFADAVAAANGSNATDRFLSAMSAHGDLVVRQANPGPSRAPKRVRVLDGTGVTVFHDAGNHTYYLAVDLREARVTYGEDGDEADLESESYELRVEGKLAADSPLTDGGQYAVAQAGPRSASVDVAPDGAVHNQDASELTVSGETTVGTGWPVTVVLSGDDDPATGVDESFTLTRRATVTSSEEWVPRRGRFNASFDRDAVPTGAENTSADVRFEGRSLLGAPVPVEFAPRRASVSVAEVDGDAAVSDVVLSVNASLSTGGFLVLREGSADGPVVGHTEYLDPGEHAVSVYSSDPISGAEVVAVAHRDANHNEWFDGPDVDAAYADGDPGDAVTLGQTASPTATPTTSRPTETAVSPRSPSGSTSSPPPSSTDTPTSGTAPGFGVAAVAVAVLVALAVLERR